MLNVQRTTLHFCINLLRSWSYHDYLNSRAILGGQGTAVLQATILTQCLKGYYSGEILLRTTQEPYPFSKTPH